MCSHPRGFAGRGSFSPDTLPAWCVAGRISLGAAWSSPGWGMLAPSGTKTREGWSFVSAKQRKAECERIKLNSGSAGLTRLAIAFFVLLLKNLLGRFEDLRGHVTQSSESSAWFSETGLALSHGPGEFYLVWPGIEGLYDEALVFTFINGCLQTHFRERGGHYILDDLGKYSDYPLFWTRFQKILEACINLP